MLRILLALSAERERRGRRKQKPGLLCLLLGVSAIMDDAFPESRGMGRLKGFCATEASKPGRAGGAGLWRKVWEIIENEIGIDPCC